MAALFLPLEAHSATQEPIYHYRLRQRAPTVEGLARAYTSPYRDVIRAKIVLYAAQGLDNDSIAARLDTPRQIVSKWRKRFFEKRLAGLERSREQLLSGSSAQGLVRVLRRKLQSITRNIYVFRWIPEQGEDLYDVLVDGITVAHVEIPRRDPDQEAIFETLPVEQYRRTRKNLTKTERRKLELALQLAQSFKATHN